MVINNKFNYDIKSICIAEWNANRLTNHINELTHFLHNKINILFISETYVTERTELKIPNYSINHTIRPDETVHGSPAIIIRRHDKKFFF